jgi:hypothetical protein
MTAPEIRQTLDDWLAPGATLPTPDALENIREQWEAIKPNLLPSYHPIIDDRLALVESCLGRMG